MIIRAISRLFHWDEFGTFDPQRNRGQAMNKPTEKSTLIDRFERAVRANGYRTRSDSTETEYQSARAALSAALAVEAGTVGVTLAMIDRLVEAELDYALSCTNGGAPSSEKQQELSRELAEARQAVRATLSRLEKQEGEA